MQNEFLDNNHLIVEKIQAFKAEPKGETYGAVLFGYREISGSIWQKMRLLTPVWINEIV